MREELQLFHHHLHTFDTFQLLSVTVIDNREREKREREGGEVSMKRSKHHLNYVLIATMFFLSILIFSPSLSSNSFQPLFPLTLCICTAVQHERGPRKPKIRDLSSLGSLGHHHHHSSSSSTHHHSGVRHHSHHSHHHHLLNGCSSLGLNPVGLNSVGLNSVGLNSVGLNPGGVNSSVNSSIGLNGMKSNSNLNEQLNGSRVPGHPNTGHPSAGHGQGPPILPPNHHGNGHQTNGQVAIPGQTAPFVPRLFDLNHRLFLWQLHLLANNAAGGGNPSVLAAAAAAHHHHSNQLNYLQNQVKNTLLNSPFSCSIQSNGNISPSSSSSSSSPSGSRMADLQAEINARRNAVKIWRAWNE